MTRTMWRAAAIAALSTTVQIQAQTFTIVGTGALPDADDEIPSPPASSGNAINDFGHVAGGSAISGGSIEIAPGVIVAEPIIPHPFRFVDGILEDLGIPGGDVPPDEFPKPQSIAFGISDDGWIVGDFTPLSDLTYHAFVWLPEAADGLPAGFTELPRWADRGRAWDISANHVVAGESRVEGELGIRAVFWTLDGGTWTLHDLGTFGGPSSSARGINELDQIAGYSSLFGGVSTTFLYLPEAAYGLPAGVNDLTPGLDGDQGADVNDLGQVVGRGDVWLPMIWLPEPALGLPAGPTVFAAGDVADADTLRFLGSIGLAQSEFTAINDDGDAVGWANFAFTLPNGGTYFSQHAIAWIDGAFSLVQQLLPEGSGWGQIVAANDINDEGQITGFGMDPEGNFVGYVLTRAPCADATGDDLVGVDDLVAVITSWGPCPRCPADVNHDGTVDVNDLNAVIVGWGACP